MLSLNIPWPVLPPPLWFYLQILISDKSYHEKDVPCERGNDGVHDCSLSLFLKINN